MSARARDLVRIAATTVIAAVTAAAATVVAAAAAVAPRAGGAASAPTLAIVVRDQTALRASPHASAQQLALLWQGEVLEVRGERIDHLQVWDHARERGGFVDATRVQKTTLAAAEAPELLALLRFVRETPGNEALGIGIAAAYLKAAPADALLGADGAEAFDAIGTMADRLAQRASTGGAVQGRAEIALAAHLEAVARHGVAFRSFELAGTMRICYDGDAFRRVLASAAADTTQRARAAIGLTRPDCIDPALPVTERQRLDLWRADVLDRVDTARLPSLWKSRVAMRRASVWSALAFQHARRGESAPAQQAARRAVAELADVKRDELADDDVAAWHDAAIRVGASRWAALPAVTETPARAIRIVAQPGEAGQTCVLLVAANGDAGAPLVRRCTYGVVWPASASVNREGNTLAIAVQPMEAWRELWLFTRQGKDWSLQVLPPSAAAPGLGYAEFAGWVPGGKQVLVARESHNAKGLKRNFEVVRLDTLGTERQAGDPATLGPFMRWQDAGWKRETVSLR
ncbi:MAG TPA: hypothetical protein VH041_02025 [Caldimonas sp.]|nr:hypothetical protein [Caldimonas sp.]HEX4233060.1 hypothetical protein [Caldimonas sp.]